MEREELYRKYRPQLFEEIIGNEIAIKSARQELSHGSHVFLMTGPAGTGKTTLARVMAKNLNAGPLSIHEINSANNRGIDSARDIMDQMRYNPTDGDSVVYILDEFHQQTKQSQEAFLKPLEDTPSHVYFFICTTNPEKLTGTLKSRCSIITMRPLTDDQMAGLIKTIAKKEKKTVDPSVVDRIVELSEGGSRNALKLLSKVLYLDTVKEQIRALRNGLDNETKETIDFCRALYNRSSTWTTISGLLRKLDLTEPERIRYAVLGYGNAILTKKMDHHALAVMNSFSVNTYDTQKFGITLMAADVFSGE
jgi:DNA polymerase III gamma/tau subunit